MTGFDIFINHHKVIYILEIHLLVQVINIHKEEIAMIEIKMFPASYGDSFLISCIGDTNTHIMVDMGFSTTYDNYISKEIQK